MKTDIENLVREIDRYCAAVGLKPSTLSRKAIDDGKFYKRVRAGGRCWPETAARIRQYMADNPAPGQAAAVDDPAPEPQEEAA